MLFRSPAESWADIILKLKATGANTVETYMPWNLHEHKPGLWNFKDNLDIYKFLEICHDHGMFVILRPGPYTELPPGLKFAIFPTRAAARAEKSRWAGLARAVARPGNQNFKFFDQNMKKSPNDFLKFWI